MPQTATVAVLIDAGFIWKSSYRLLGQGRKWKPEEVVQMARACLAGDERLFRIFFYDCLPFEGERHHPVTNQKIDYSSNALCIERTKFLNDLSKRDYVAFRKGRLSHKGWKLKDKSMQALLDGTKTSLTATDLIEDFQQKRVDMKIGLDVAWMSSRGIVEKIIILGSDTDYIPAMKHARREGTQVVIVGIPNPKQGNCPDMHPELREHADECRLISYSGGIFSINPYIP